MATSTLTRRPPSPVAETVAARPPAWLAPLWAAFAVAALLTLGRTELATWGWAVPLAAAALVAATATASRCVDWLRLNVDTVDLVVMAGLYLAVVGLFRAAFVGFTVDSVLGLFLCFAGGLLLGVVGPIVYTVWLRGRPLSSLGLGATNLRATLGLALVLAAVQFGMTLATVALPAPVDWVPLLVMSLTVGLFEAVFFRGFVQGRLQASLGTVPSVAIAAAAYALYHVGYGMDGSEMMFLFGLGVVYAIAYRLAGSILVLWPLLTPLGAFFNNLRSGDIELPWASIAGFADVLALMALAYWLARRHERRGRRAPAGRVVTRR